MGQIPIQNKFKKRGSLRKKFKLHPRKKWKSRILLQMGQIPIQNKFKQLRKIKMMSVQMKIQSQEDEQAKE
jgi:hypothetical protein